MGWMSRIAPQEVENWCVEGELAAKWGIFAPGLEVIR